MTRTLVLQNLSTTIIADPEGQEFTTMCKEHALKWLQNHSWRVGQEFNMFLKRHGHRCIREFDLVRSLRSQLLDASCRFPW